MNGLHNFRLTENHLLKFIESCGDIRNAGLHKIFTNGFFSLNEESWFLRCRAQSKCVRVHL